jgi:thiosulfate/3-mercaptopyruvate sulfurtransferase
MSDWDGRALVETEWLAARLERDDIRIIDSSVIMTRSEDGEWRPSSGLDAYREGHIPGAQFIDLTTELRDPESPLNYTLPQPDAFASAMAEKGVGDEHMVVVYATQVPWWATRLWWMLRANGHDNVAVLNGGLKKWQAEGRALSTEVPGFAPANFTATRRPELIADKARVQAALQDDGIAVVNALSPQLFTGESDLGYARRGRITGSVNLSALALVDHGSGAYLGDDALRQAAADVAAGGDEIICYCGGGIAATMDALVFDLLGYDRVSVYDASLQEWAADDTLPMATG